MTGVHDLQTVLKHAENEIKRQLQIRDQIEGLKRQGLPPAELAREQARLQKALDDSSAHYREILTELEELAETVSGPKVFLSYSRRNVYLAEELFVRLIYLGVTPFFDLAELTPGQDWESRIGGAIAGCDAFVLVAAPDSVRDSYAVTDELPLALKHERPVIVVSDRSCALPPPLRGRRTYRIGHRAGHTLARFADDVKAGRFEPDADRRARRWLWSVPPLAVLCVVAAMAMELTVAALVGWSSLWTADSAYGAVQVTSAWGGHIIPASRLYAPMALVAFVQCAVLLACLVSLTAGRWRIGYVYPVLFAAAVPIIVTQATANRLRLDAALVPPDTAARAASVMSLLSRLSEVGAAPLVVLLPVVFGSRAVLWRSNPGDGSVLARVRIFGTGLNWRESMSMMFMPRLLQRPGSELRELAFMPARRPQPTFTVGAAEGNEGFRDRLHQALLAWGLQPTESDAEVSFSLLTDKSGPQDLGDHLASAGIVLVQTAPIAADVDDPVLRRTHLLDFRRMTLDPSAMAEILGRRPLFELPLVIPRPVAQWAAPTKLNLMLWANASFANLYVIVLGLQLWSLRTNQRSDEVVAVFCTALAVSTASLHLGVVRRLATFRQFLIGSRLLSCGQVMLGLLVLASPWPTVFRLYVGFLLLVPVPLFYWNVRHLDIEEWFPTTSRHRGRSLYRLSLLPYVPYALSFASPSLLACYSLLR